MTDPRGRHITLRKPEEPQDPESMHHGGSFKKYMEFKNQKLREQFQGDAVEATEGEMNTDKLFAGICIHVNGFTNPTHAELKQIMAAHGGVFEVYYSKQRVTHIICSNLPTAKIKALEKERTATPIVRPEWIVDCMEAGKILPHQDYLLWRLRDRPGQSTLSEFRPQPVSRSSMLAQDAPAQGQSSRPAGVHQPASVPIASPRPQGRPGSTGSREQPAAAAASRLEQQNAEDHAHGSAAQAAPDGGHEALREQADGNAALPSIYDAADNDDQGWQGSPASVPNPPGATAAATAAAATATTALPDDAAGNNLQKAQQVAAACRASCDMLKGAPKSSRDDPRFMDNYYKASRLHFIGTWKARIEALAAKSSGEAPAPNVPSKPSQRTVIHLDMDCFFASVAALTDTCLRGLPLAVCHSNSAQGTGEVSSANYEARAHGIAAMMCIGEAKRLCPSLVVMPYQYEKYQAISEHVYKILLGFTSAVQPLSCDEAFLDVTGLGEPAEVANSIREKIFRETGCTASAGVSCNMLLARIATRAGKPNGQFNLKADQVDDHLLPLKVDSLPGVGWSTRQRLHAMGLETVGDVRQSSQEVLQREFGSRNGALIWAAAKGQDDRPVEPMKLRRSVGAEVNWGIRFTCEADADTFLDGLASELHNRMVEAGVKGRCIALKMKRRKSNAPEPIKFLGHGPCDNLSRSVTLNRFTDAAADLSSESRALLRALRVPATQIRGIGISVSKLDNDPASSVSGTGRGALPRAAPSIATAFRPFRRSDIGNSELTKEDLIAAGKSGDPYSGIVPERIAMLPKALQQLISPEKHSGELDTAVPEQQRAVGTPQKPPAWAMKRSESYCMHTDSDGQDSKEVAEAHKAFLEAISAAGEDRDDLSAETAALDGEDDLFGEFLDGDNAVVADSDSEQAFARDIEQFNDNDSAPAPDRSLQTAEEALAGTPLQDFSTDIRRQPGPEGPGEGTPKPVAEAALEDMGAAALEAVAVDPSIGILATGPPVASTTPILALPPASQLDASVLDALPLQMKREFEEAYGIGRFRSPPGKSKRKRGGSKQPVIARPLKRQLTDLHAAGPSRQSELTPSRVDLGVLRELPLEVQQEVAEELARVQRAAAIRPLQQSSFVRFPAPEPPPDPEQPPPLADAEAECPEELWPRLEGAIAAVEANLAEEAGSTDQRTSVGPERLKSAARLAELGIVVLELGFRLINDDLEGLQFLLRRLATTAKTTHHVASSVSEWITVLESEIFKTWQGAKMRTRCLL